MDNSFSSSDSSGLEVAIIGMAGRFPGARSVEEFWQNLKAGVESISFFSDQELQASGVDAATLNKFNKESGKSHERPGKAHRSPLTKTA
jgi:acyl transferase domain-containing protein